MVKFYALLKHKPGTSRAAFQTHWKEVHVPLAKRIRRAKRYSQSHVADMKVPGLQDADFDGVAEVWFADLESALGLSEDPDYLNGAALDDPNFIDVDQVDVAYTDEIDPSASVEVPGGDAIKVLEFIKRSPDVSLQEFSERWPDKARDAARALGATHQVITLSLAGAIPAEANSPSDVRFANSLNETYAGVSEMWWEDAAAFRAAAEALDPWRTARPIDLVDEAGSLGMTASDFRVVG
jgi:uncharacterized protein (TIGR02118 family)